jgi:TolB protein
VNDMNAGEHGQVREWLHRKREELGEAEREALEGHLQVCPACRTYAHSVQILEDELSSAFHARWDQVELPALEQRADRGRQVKVLPALAATSLTIVLILAVVLSSPLAEMLVERAALFTTARELSGSPSEAHPEQGTEIVADPTLGATEEHLIAFVSLRDGNREIYVIPAPAPLPQAEVDARVENLVNLTQNPAQDYAPVWSPDGERIAFVSDRSGQPELYVMQKDGTQVSRLSEVPGARAYGEPSWSPDGQQVAVQLILEYPFTDESYTQIYLVAVDGSGAVPISDTEFPLSNLEPKWSPIGDRIASRTLGIMQAFSRGAPQGEPEQIRLSDGLANVGTLAWSPDGSSLAYFASCQYCIENQDLKPALYLIEADGDNPRVLFDFEPRDLHGIGLSWSPDGRQLLLLAAEVQSGVRHLYLIAADGSSMTRLTDLSAGAMESVPGWSPDGRRLVFALQENGEAGIYILDLQARMSGETKGALTRLNASRRGDSSPRWQP